MEKWLVQAKKADFNGIGKKYRISPIVARVIRNRNIITDDEIDEYLNSDISKMHSPESLPDMEIATKTIIDAINSGKKIRVIGDYDVDGVCSGYILTDGLLNVNANVDFEVPHRITDGYGINERLIRKAKEDKVDLIVTCDNGIAAINQIELAKELLIDVVVTDHHEIPFDIVDGEKIYKMPPAIAVVDQKRIDSTYPFNDLCGAGVAYKTIESIYKKIGIDNKDINKLLDKYKIFASIATVADIVALKGENRTLVKYGLKNIKNVDNPGLRALIEVNGLSEKEITSYHIGFVIGPCINAAGRLESAKMAYDLFACKNSEEALIRARELKDLNDNRKSLTEQGLSIAIDNIDKDEKLKNDRVIVAYLPDCHESLAGIIAGKLKELYYKPSIVFTDANSGFKGSGRSVEGYSMFEELTFANIEYLKDKGEPLMEKFGGHPMAAGISIKKEKLEEFRRILNSSKNITEEMLIRKIWIDVPLPFQYITVDLIEQLSLLEPFGAENEKPVFAEKCIAVENLRVYGQNKNVISMTLINSAGFKMKATYFELENNFINEINKKYGEKIKDSIMSGKMTEVPMNIIYYPEINEYNNRKSVKVIVNRMS